MASTSDRIFGLLRGLVGALLKPGKAPAAPRPARTTTTPARGPARPYAGDFTGTATVAYSPKPDGAPDPGEIVWTWVPFEEDPSQGKDRPVLVVARNGKRLLALMLTSKDHSNDHRGNNDYVEIGTGAWDRQGRPSEVKLDRVLQIAEGDMRREGAVLDARRFAVVADGLRRRHGWK
ncbi:hypothetical protein AL755_12265 [Arthrobacter sp. ERGS1:01]|uniref:type II toxin-antitoxin system PemK/MazF family toxin n=1 Tax=Arthrobacter sp. ERGS1:01 TaxID=1704044 RepID=UPI0006B5346A|nr:type II toxin-antitoxin system PemK/MazF family toxin [Arthrobacter sp. ERGS1:01]ALE06064.1 hypothetical protein AL755_12265 [Arthrobacter sp. ERGS1:01]